MFLVSIELWFDATKLQSHFISLFRTACFNTQVAWRPIRSRLRFLITCRRHWRDGSKKVVFSMRKVFTTTWTVRISHKTDGCIYHNCIVIYWVSSILYFNNLWSTYCRLARIQSRYPLFLRIFVALKQFPHLSFSLFHLNHDQHIYFPAFFFFFLSDFRSFKDSVTSRNCVKMQKNATAFNSSIEKNFSFII